MNNKLVFYYFVHIIRNMKVEQYNLNIRSSYAPYWSKTRNRNIRKNVSV